MENNCGKQYFPSTKIKKIKFSSAHKRPDCLFTIGEFNNQSTMFNKYLHGEP